MTYLDRRGEDLGALNEKCDWPTEFLRDPSSWLEADKMEALIKLIEQEYGARAAEGDESLLEAAGHACKDLRSWGVLDSVLRMVQTPKDLFSQPERLLSYFVSPAPPIGDVRRESEGISFVLPVSEVQFPYVTSFLRAALEALPTYINKPMASVSWENSRVSISWSENQASLFAEGQDNDLSLHPELMRDILHDLETSQKELESMKRQLIEKDRELEQMRKTAARVEKPAQSENSESDQLAPENQRRISNAIHDLYRLGDYFARGQQLITLLIGQGRQTRQVQEAMRRVDWEFVALEGPQTVKRTVAELQSLKDAADAKSSPESKATPRSAQKSFDALLRTDAHH